MAMEQIQQAVSKSKGDGANSTGSEQIQWRWSKFNGQ